jgi:hypothetical protein
MIVCCIGGSPFSDEVIELDGYDTSANLYPTPHTVCR